MFFPNCILYREELLSTTVTYAVDLSETEFLNLKPIIPIEQLGIRPAEFRLNAVADKILERYAIHELHYLTSVNAIIQVELFPSLNLRRSRRGSVDLTGNRFQLSFYVSFTNTTISCCRLLVQTGDAGRRTLEIPSLKISHFFGKFLGFFILYFAIYLWLKTRIHPVVNSVI